MTKRLFSHMDFVEYVKKVLQSSDYEFLGYSEDDKYDMSFLLTLSGKQVIEDFKSDLPDLKTEVIEKILVLTNKQAFNELSEIMDRLSGKILDNDVKLMLIPYPIIPNNFAKKECGNIVFTVSQLIGAIKSGVVKIKGIPAPYQDYMVTMMRKHGYRNFKLITNTKKRNKKDLDISALNKKPKE